MGRGKGFSRCGPDGSGPEDGPLRGVCLRRTAVEARGHEPTAFVHSDQLRVWEAAVGPVEAVDVRFEQRLGVDT